MKIEDSIHDTVARTVLDLKAMSGEIYIREGAAKVLIRELCWALIDKEGLGICSYELADHLDVMSELLKDHRESEDDNAAAELS